jgi:hypothetical protein
VSRSRVGAALILAGLAGASVAAASYRLLLRHPPGGAQRWSRRNFRGTEVSLLAGPALAAGLVAGSAVAGGRSGCATAIGVGGAAAFGLLDDLHGGTHARGFRGHLRALGRGEVTSGLVKLVGIGATGLVAGLVIEPRPRDAAVTGALVAGTANLVNLLDLRPGRALKAVLVVAVPTLVGTGAAPAAAVAGAAAALLPEDLGERAMLGDTGANAAGAALGTALAAAARPGARRTLLLGVVALTAASERVSFTAVIDATPVLRTIDRLGRRRDGQP